MLVTLVGRDQHGIYMTDNVLGPLCDIGDLGHCGHRYGIGRIIGPHVGDLNSWNAQRGSGLFGNVVSNARIRALGQCPGIIATIDDDRPGIGMAIAFNHAQHCELEWPVAKRELHCHRGYHAVQPPSTLRTCPVM